VSSKDFNIVSHLTLHCHILCTVAVAENLQYCAQLETRALLHTSHKLKHTKNPVLNLVLFITAAYTSYQSQDEYVVHN